MTFNTWINLFFSNGGIIVVTIYAIFSVAATLQMIYKTHLQKSGMSVTLKWSCFWSWPSSNGLLELHSQHLWLSLWFICPHWASVCKGAYIMNITAILFVISIICFLISLPILTAYIKWSKSYSKYWSESVYMIEGLSDQILHHWSEKKNGYPRDLIQSQRYPFFLYIYSKLLFELLNIEERYSHLNFHLNLG